MVDQTFVNHFNGDADSGEAGAFAIAGLEHVEDVGFDSEFEVLHVFEVFFEGISDFVEFFIGFGHFFFEICNGFWGADAGDDVFALGVDEVFAVEDFFAVSRVASEGHTGSAVVPHVSEDHGLDVDGGAPFVGDVVFLTVYNGTVVVPGFEDSADGSLELFVDVLGES